MSAVDTDGETRGCRLCTLHLAHIAPLYIIIHTRMGSEGDIAMCVSHVHLCPLCREVYACRHTYAQSNICARVYMSQHISVLVVVYIHPRRCLHRTFASFLSPPSLPGSLLSPLLSLCVVLASTLIDANQPELNPNRVPTQVVGRLANEFF